MNSATSPRNILQGYVTNLEFGGLRIPVTIQSMLIREYAARNKFLFKLSVGEYAFPGCFLQLEGLFPQLSDLEGIGMCSMFMLPKNSEIRHRIYERCISAGAALHLIIEGIVIREIKDVERVEEILSFHRCFKDSLTTIASELLPELPLPDCFT